MISVISGSKRRSEGRTAQSPAKHDDEDIIEDDVG